MLSASPPPGVVIKFLRRLDSEYEPDLELHPDNSNLTAPTNMRRCAAFWIVIGASKFITSQPVRVGSTWWNAGLPNSAARLYGEADFANVPDLIQAIFDFIAQWNAEPTPFVWTAKAEDILAKIERCRQRLEEISPGSTKPKRRLKKAA